MYERHERRWNGGILLAILLIVIASTAIIVMQTNVSWALVPSAIFLTIGLVYIIFGIHYALRGQPLDYYFGPKQSSYSIGWGIIALFIGVIVLNGFVIKGMDTLLISAITLLIIGIVALIGFVAGGKRGRS